jgi:threonine dehydrogenase-like Zn-dependent dehydrogenase
MKALYFENRISKVIALKAASLVNRFAALGPMSPLKYDDIPEPRLPGPRWLKVRNIACGLCGTDLHFMFMDMDPDVFVAAVPGIERKFLGHELVGEVIELGAEVEGLKIGDRVTMRIDWPSCYQLEIDPPCPQCAQGNYMLCENVGKQQLALRDVGGGFSPYMVMHRSQPFRVPDTMSTDQALLLEPVASAIHGVMKHLPTSGAKVLVIGGGTIGLLTVAVLKHFAPEVEIFCLARHAFQKNIAAKLGARVIAEGSGLYQEVAELSGGRRVTGYFGNEILLGGMAAVYDTIGNDTSLNHALRLVTSGGHVVLIGINFKPGRIDYTPIWAREIKLTGINCHATEADGRTSFEMAAELIMARRDLPELMLSHRFPMHKWKDAVKMFLSKSGSGAVKIVLEHQSGR